MRRNWDMIRRILEDAESERLMDELADMRSKKSAYIARYESHADMAKNAGLVDDFGLLTMLGYDILATMRSSLWPRITAWASENDLPITFDVIKAYSERLTKDCI